MHHQALKALFMLLLPLAFATQGLAQFSCGTELTKAQKNKELNAMQNSSQQSQIVSPCVHKELSVVAHIASGSTGSPVVSTAAIETAMLWVNQQFEGCCISFKVCRFDTMPEARFASWIDLQDEPDAIGLHYEDNHINMYFASTVTKSGVGTVGGYAYFPGGYDLVVISTGPAVVMQGTMAHELGHFFGLYHTHETGIAPELADGSNCTVAGDLLCDTRADPFVLNPSSGSPLFTVDGTCNVVPPAQDAAGNWYLPPNNNIMSYYPNTCGQKFTTQQLNRMVDQYLTFRSNLW